MSTVRVGLVLALLVAAPMAAAWPTPGFNGEEAQEVTGRVFPEARETNDFVSYFEAREGVQLLEEQAPDLLEYHEIGRSRGWLNLQTGEREPQPVFAVTVTDETSDVPESERSNLLFQLSIHGDEKGGREGGLRVIEDFVLAHQTGEDVRKVTQTRLDMLEHQRLIFVFANPDGWTHEEVQYRHNDACSTSATCEGSSGGGQDQAGEPGVEGGDFVRVNANGTDLNRQAPVVGYVAEDHRTLEEPSTYATFTWLEEAFDSIDYAADLHGMSPPADGFADHAKDGVCVETKRAGEVCTKDGHFVLGMISAGQYDTTQDLKQTEVAARANRYINRDPTFSWWRTTPAAHVVGGEVAVWGTVWDTIGYTDTGFTGDWYSQEHGLDAVTIDYEYAYNNFGTDNRYDAVGMEMNRFFIASTRNIVAAFQDSANVASEPVPVSQGTEVGWVPTDVVQTPPEVDLSERKLRFADRDYRASVNGYFLNISQRMPSSDALRPVPAGSMAGGLSGLDVLVVPGSAVKTLSSEDRDAIDAFVRDGGRLVVTDQALQLASDLGIDVTAGDQEAYAGYTNPDRAHWLLDGVRGLARQTVEPVPLGYQAGGLPIWYYDAGDVEAAGGDVAGVSPGEGDASLGVIPHGDGDVVFVGSLLPDPTDRNNHPYRLADHGVTYTGRQIMRNAMGLTVADLGGGSALGGGATPSGAEEPALPGSGPVAALAALVAVAAALRRRR